MDPIHRGAAVVGLASALLILFFVVFALSNILLEEVEDFYCSEHCGLLTEVRIWTDQLGPPQQLPDKAFASFLYWPREGIAIQANPLYEAQGRRRSDPLDTLATSIFVPCRNTTPISAFNIYIEGALNFSTTPLERFPGSKLARACQGSYRSFFLFSGRLDSDRIWLSNMPFYLLGRSAVIIHLEQDQPAVLEIVESNLFSWYD